MKNPLKFRHRDLGAKPTANYTEFRCESNGDIGFAWAYHICISYLAWLVGLLACLLVCWFVGWLVAWFVGWLPGCGIIYRTSPDHFPMVSGQFSDRHRTILRSFPDNFPIVFVHFSDNCRTFFRLFYKKYKVHSIT